MNDELIDARRSLGHVLNDSAPLIANDYQLIGRFVQAYCIADLEARMAINALNQTHTGIATDYALRLNDKDVIDHLERGAQEWQGEPEVREGLLMVVAILRGHRHLRHMFAHWAGRRIPKHDAYIFFTASLGNQKIGEGEDFFEQVEGANIRYGVIPIDKLVEELNKLQGHVQYLTNMGRQIAAQVEAIAGHFATVRQRNAAAEPRTMSRLANINKNSD